MGHLSNFKSGLKVLLLLGLLLLNNFIQGLLMSTLTDDKDKNIKIVMNAAKTCYPNNKILAQLMAAQAILESRLLGVPSELAKKYNNLFGIKGFGTAGYVILKTTEYTHNGEEIVNARFASNKSIEDSFEQRKNLIDNGTTDNPNRYKNLYNATTFEQAANMIRLDGYATSPTYSQDLIEIYNKYLKDM